MRFPVFTLVALSAAALLSTGCAKTEQKFGRGMRNVTEIVRLGEMQRSIEQTALFDGADKAYTAGFIKGLNKTLARTGVGVYELVTAPLPPYDPVFTDYLSPEPGRPDTFRPDVLADQVLATDKHMGFSGGDIAPMIPNSRFSVFDN